MPLNKSLSENIKHFTDVEEKEIDHGRDENKEIANELLKQQIRDNDFRFNAKKYGSFFFGALLVLQNIYVYWLVWQSYQSHSLQELSIVLSVLIAGTLTETYLIARTIVEYIFKDGLYNVVQKS